MLLLADFLCVLQCLRHMSRSRMGKSSTSCANRLSRMSGNKSVEERCRHNLPVHDPLFGQPF